MNFLDILEIDPDYLYELLCMADMYAHKCTKQQEKFDYYQRNGITWRWEDCQAAFEMLKETGIYFELRQQWTAIRQRVSA